MGQRFQQDLLCESFPESFRYSPKIAFNFSGGLLRNAVAELEAFSWFIMISLDWENRMWNFVDRMWKEYANLR
jgi:hypothetical protein